MITGKVARSTAGHDKGSIYLIIKEETDFCYVADGRLKTLQNPKKKNRRHLQVYTQTDTGEIGRRLRDKEKVRDHEIKHFLKTITIMKDKSEE